MSDDTEKDLSDTQNTDETATPVTSVIPVNMSMDEQLAKQVRKLPRFKIPKEKRLYYMVGGFCLVILLFGLYACQPKDGPMAYGICSTFLELSTPYPETLRHTGLEGSRTAIRIYFTSIDPFGELRQEMMECTFAADDVMGMRLAQVMRNRRPVDPVLVRKFNLTLPAIMASDPYRIGPPKWKNPLLGNEPSMQQSWPLPDFVQNR